MKKVAWILTTGFLVCTKLLPVCADRRVLSACPERRTSVLHKPQAAAYIRAEKQTVPASRQPLLTLIFYCEHLTLMRSSCYYPWIILEASSAAPRGISLDSDRCGKKWSHQVWVWHTQEEAPSVRPCHNQIGLWAYLWGRTFSLWFNFLFLFFSFFMHMGFLPGVRGGQKAEVSCELPAWTM